MLSHLTRGVCLAVITGAMAFASSTPAKAEADFSGKTIEWIIPFKEGGGSDKWSRFYAPLLSEALPGKPAVVIKNMPGAGSTKGANYFQTRAKTAGCATSTRTGTWCWPRPRAASSTSTSPWA